jgi:glutaminyl-peptide cyclotransferase
VSGHTGVMHTSFTGSLPTGFTGSLRPALVCGLALLAWVAVGCAQPAPTDAPDNQAQSLGGAVSATSAGSLSSDDLRAAFDGDPVALRYEVLDQVPADPTSFTQGLEFLPDGRLFESTGRYGRSALRRIDPATGATVDEVAVDPGWFAEGITAVASDGPTEIAMLTWREQVVAFYDPDTLDEVRRATYSGEGWGLCQLDDGTLVMSDGTPTLTRRDPASFAVIDEVGVTRSGTPLSAINELECVGDLVWANVWQTNWIVVIDPGTGEVLAELDARGLREQSGPGGTAGGDVLNGIAAVPGTTDRFWLAGKLWAWTWVVRVYPG